MLAQLSFCPDGNLCLESDWPDSQTFHPTAEWCGRGGRSCQRTSWWGENFSERTGRNTQERHDTEIRWLLRKHIESSSPWAKHQWRLHCAREKCAHAFVQASVLSTEFWYEFVLVIVFIVFLIFSWVASSVVVLLVLAFMFPVWVQIIVESCKCVSNTFPRFLQLLFSCVRKDFSLFVMIRAIISIPLHCSRMFCNCSCIFVLLFSVIRVWSSCWCLSLGPSPFCPCSFLRRCGQRVLCLQVQPVLLWRGRRGHVLLLCFSIFFGCDLRQWRRGACRSDYNTTSAGLSVAWKNKTHSC